MKSVIDVEPQGQRPYPVLCCSNAASALPSVWDTHWSRAVLIADDNTDSLFGDRVAAALDSLDASPLRLKVAPGEASKSRERKASLEDAMLGAGIDRSACIVALGGGVVLDLAGFVAATYMRGIAHINIATTLLAQVDASVGGKTAINSAHGKNLIGAFHQPRAVLLDTGALGSLDDMELRNGLAEAVKHAVLRDGALFAELERWSAQLGDGGLRPSDDVIATCVRIKAEVVAADERDTGMRNILNFGHTVAHAIEHAGEHATPHGHAVAMGMVVEARLAAREGAFPESDLQRLVALLQRLGLPTEPPIAFADAEPHLARDKKTAGGVVRCAIPSQIGRVEASGDGGWTRAVSSEALRDAWQGPS
jgi:3-dehydroquinate synthase